MHYRSALFVFLVGLAGAAAGQTGVVSPGLSSPGNNRVGNGATLGRSSLPVCTVRQYACTVTYVFTGNGYWTEASNWQAGAIPPAVLPGGQTIIVNPQSGGECILNVSQTISAGATFVLQSPKRVRVLKELVFLK